MKLRTKFQDEDFELGEVVEGVIVECLGKHEEKLRVIATAAKGGQSTFYYNSIKKFMADWEDAPEEPKGIVKVEKSIVPTCVHIEYTTEKEAEKAVERLCAWKRLKEKGFRFDGIDFSRRTIKFKVPSSFFDGEENIFVSEQSDTDLKFLFGGEE